MVPTLNASSGIISCEAASTPMNITVGFARSATIQVPFKNLVIPVFDPQTNLQNTTAAGLPLCQFAVYATNGTLSAPYYMGTSIMQAMYLVFDLDNAQISIATPVYDTAFSEISAIPAGPNGLARASLPSVVTAQANTAVDASLVTATGSPGSNSPVAKTTDVEVGIATGPAAIPTNAYATTEGILSTGVLSKASSNTFAASSTAQNTSTHPSHAGSAHVVVPLACTYAPWWSIAAASITGILSAMILL